ncbi:major capsid protein [Microbacterium sp.]|uniref:major capsid protein n=1 Tax=Microbacterium sp. TaxID=51671 RepID=UPI003A92FF12
MAITLADAAVNTQDDIDFHIIDEFRKQSAQVLNRITFDDSVSPGTAGSTLVYGYTRVKTERGAAFRSQNGEYVASEAKRERFTVPLSPLGGAYKVDRVLANLGDAQTNEIVFQQGQLVKSSVARFVDEFINGVEAAFDQTTPGFDGIDAAVTGTTTESFATGTTAHDFSALTDKTSALNAKRAITKWLRSMDGVDVIYGNADGVAVLEYIADLIGYYNTTKDEWGQVVSTFRDIPFVDLGKKSGSNDDVIGTDGTTGVTSLYGVRFGLDGVHGASVKGGELLSQWLPDFSTSGAVKTGEVELGPVGLAIKATKSAGAFRVKVQ